MHDAYATVVTDIDVDGKIINFHNRGQADIGILAQTFQHKQFLYPPRHLSTIQRYNEIVASSKTPLIIDAGANIGTASVWFLETFPKSHVVAIEPDKSNFSILKKNCQHYNADLREGALSNYCGRGAIVDPGRGSLGFMTSEGNEFPVWSASQIILEKIASEMIPFIFKCDIEGGEAQLFQDDTNWIDEFDLLIVEPHDWMLPGRATSQNFLKAVSRFPRDFLFWGECIFSYKNAVNLPDASLVSDL